MPRIAPITGFTTAWITLASFTLVAVDAASALGPHPVTIETTDGITLQGWYIHPGSVPHEEVHDADAELFSDYPAVVLLHMYGGDKTDWVSTLGKFYERDIAALTIDMRGHSESTVGLDGEDLAVRVRNRDEALFNEMWQDAAAAVDWLVAKGHRRDRIALVGASVGCSVAIDAARRDPHIKTVVALSPGAKYLGVDTLAHLNDWSDRSLLIVSTEEEWPVAKPVYERLEQLRQQAATQDTPAPRPERWILPNTNRQAHGTRMLETVDGIQNRLLDWLELHLAAPAAPDTQAPPTPSS